MIDPAQIPDEVVEAAARARYEAMRARHGMINFPSWDEIKDPLRQFVLDEERAAIAAALNAWPGMTTGPKVYHRQDAVMHLPLTEKYDDSV